MLVRSLRLASFNASLALNSSIISIQSLLVKTYPLIYIVNLKGDITLDPDWNLTLHPA